MFKKTAGALQSRFIHVETRKTKPRSPSARNRIDDGLEQFALSTSRVQDGKLAELCPRLLQPAHDLLGQVCCQKRRRVVDTVGFPAFGFKCHRHCRAFPLSARARSWRAVKLVCRRHVLLLVIRNPSVNVIDTWRFNCGCVDSVSFALACSPSGLKPFLQNLIVSFPKD